MNLLRNLGVSLTHRRRRNQLARRLDPKPQIVAQMLLLFRTILADGIVREKEMKVFSDICGRQFGVLAEEMMALHSYLERWQRRVDAEAHIASLSQLPMDQRRRLVDLMVEIAAVSSEGDAEPGTFSRQAQIFITDARSALGLSAQEWQPAPAQNHLKS
ncbi:TerB family tellurite resistance protein [Rhizobium sp. EC-SD404]|uniref:TerB family tellurite resistance protein n=1 Tax=Rhizobium sp. EC-SD404 TaxID=2038389 RepID=UPI00125FEE01|nr:TerB family tellurite resistance protein [Rhizobium sp. EC-SD404]